MLPPQWFSRTSVVHDPPQLLPASLALGVGSSIMIIPRISRAWQYVLMVVVSVVAVVPGDWP